MAKHKFHTRSFISFLLFISIFWILFSGTVLYIAPPGRVAHWQHWTLFGFDKNQWQAQHTIFSYIFIILAIIHAFSLNWRNLWSYVKVKSKNGFRKKDEFISAVALSLLLFFGTSFEIPPLSSFFELGETIGATWEEKSKIAPIPHTENLTLEEIASNYIDDDAENIMQILSDKGIRVLDKNQTLKEIAIQNNISPSEVYHFVSPDKKESGKGGSGKGYGRITLKELSFELGIDIVDIIKLLKANKIEASASKTIRDIASENGLHPSEVMKIIKSDH